MDTGHLGSNALIRVKYMETISNKKGSLRIEEEDNSGVREGTWQRQLTQNSNEAARTKE